MSYRDDLVAIEARVESLYREASAKIDELKQAQQLATDARKLVRSRVIEAELATPCTAAWDEMKGDARVRHCGQCKKNVYNFSELTREEVDALIVQHEGKLCARFFLRADGTMVTKDCKSNIRMRPHKLALGLGAAAMAAGALAVSCGTTVAAHRAKEPAHEIYRGETDWEPGPEEKPQPLEAPPPGLYGELSEASQGGVGFYQGQIRVKNPERPGTK